MILPMMNIFIGLSEIKDGQEAVFLSAAKDLLQAILKAPDNYYLHLSMRSQDNYSHCFYVFENESAKFVIGSKSVYDGPVYQDFPRDGQWHDIFVPMSAFAGALANTNLGASFNLLVFLTEGVQGASLRMRDVYFCNKAFMKVNPIYRQCLTDFGICGDDLTWEQNCEGVLTVSGTGEMYNASDWTGYYFWMDYFNEVSSVIISDGVTTIGASAFNRCKNLTSVTIPNSVTSIGYYAFSECSRLTSPIYNDHVFAFMPTSYSGAYTIPNGIESIAGSAFYNCSSLTSVTIPNSVTSIGDYAFYDCYSLTSVTIGNSVTNIGSGAFYSCYSLTSVMMESETPPAIGTDIFSSSLVIYIPCGTIEAYKSAESWAGYAEWFKYAPSPYTITSKETNGGYVEIPYLSACDASAELTAVPERGYIFAKWEDGNTDNPRTVEVTGDRTVEAIFDYQRIGKCGKDSALTWTFDPTDFSLNIAGSGELTDNYTYGRFVKSVTIGNGISIVGNSAFYGFEQVQSIVLGTSVKVIENYAFYGCGAYFDMNTESYINDKLKSITCYSQRPPTVKEDAFNYNLPYSTIIYVPADYVATYQAHDFWGMYDVRPLGATTAETTEVKVEPTSTTASVAWPAVENAATYELVIKDKNGNVVCMLIFNANGQLTQIAFSAPARDNATQAAGFSFTVTGLEEGTSYDLTITAKDGNGTTLDEKTMSFTTATTYTTIDTLPTDELRSSKFIRNGQLFIQKAGRTYTVQGLEVK